MPTARNRRIVTVDEYHRMADAGILAENDRVELIDGEIVEKMTIGPRHNACVNSAVHAFVYAVAERAIVQAQGSFHLSFLSEPEPDIVLLRPRADYYAKALATPLDVLLVVEVADSSLAFDCDHKRPLYAEAGIGEFWLVDLTTNSVFRHRDPDGRAYRTVERHTRGETLAPVLLPECRIPVNVLLIE